MRCKIRWNWKGNFFVFFFFFASGGALLSTATKVPKNAVQGGRDAVFPFPLEEPPNLETAKEGRRARLPSFESPLRGRGDYQIAPFAARAPRHLSLRGAKRRGNPLSYTWGTDSHASDVGHWLGMTEGAKRPRNDSATRWRGVGRGKRNTIREDGVSFHRRKAVPFLWALSYSMAMM